jgi:hypothetical protein
MAGKLTRDVSVYMKIFIKWKIFFNFNEF